MKTGKKRIFLDCASVTPIDPVVEKEIQQVQKKFWGNPSSLHEEGEEAKKILEEARIKIAKILHCRADGIIFTSGGTESLNLAIYGAVRSWKEKNSGVPHIITSTIEHPAVLEPINHLLKKGKIEASFVSPGKNGVIAPDSIKKEIKENTALVVIQHANNEIGTIQPIRKIKEKIKGCGGGAPILLVDACQSALYEDVSIERLGADMIVLDGIKTYGPRGAGILALKHGINISPMVCGGGQEKGIRSGTENVPAAAGLAKSLEIAEKTRVKESARLAKLRDFAVVEITKNFPSASINGSLENRLPNNLNFCFPNQDSEFLVIKLDTLGFAVSAASACHAISLENSSHVIKAIGKPECAASSLRITMGKDTKKADLEKLISALKKIIK